MSFPPYERLKAETRCLAGLALVVVLSSGWPPSAFADASDWVELQWNAADGCSESSDVLRAIDAQLGGQFQTNTRLQAQGEVRALAGSEYALELRYTTGSGAFDERRIRGESCAEVTRAAALALALALDPRPEPELGVAPQPSAAANAPSDSRISVGLLGFFDTPIMNHAAFGGGVRAAWRLAAFELSLGVHLFLPVDTVRDDISMRLQYWAMDVGACYLAPIGAWRVGPCVRFELGWLTGEPRGEVDDATSETARVHAASAVGAARVPLSAAVQLAFDVGVEWVARRPQFTVTELGTVASPAVWGARASVGPVVVF